jgi:hypothetical protein
MNKTTLLIILLICLFISGCGKEARHRILGGVITQPISGAIDIGKEWIEIVPPKQLKAISSLNYIVVKAKGLDKGPDRYRSVKYPDGSTGKIEARLYDDKGQAVDFDCYFWHNITELTIWKKGTNFEDDDPSHKIQGFPHNTTFVRAQIRSDTHLHCDSIEWVGDTPNK